jgi:hypothetical protein
VIITESSSETEEKENVLGINCKHILHKGEISFNTRGCEGEVTNAFEFRVKVLQF